VLVPVAVAVQAVQLVHGASVDQAPLVHPVQVESGHAEPSHHEVHAPEDHGPEGPPNGPQPCPPNGLPEEGPQPPWPLPKGKPPGPPKGYPEPEGQTLEKVVVCGAAPVREMVVPQAELIYVWMLALSSALHDVPPRHDWKVLSAVALLHSDLKSPLLVDPMMLLKQVFAQDGKLPPGPPPKFCAETVAAAKTNDVN